MPEISSHIQSKPRPKQESLVVIYAKSPISGTVKTRLARGSNRRFAANAYKALLEHTVQQFSGHPNVVIACSPQLRHGFVRRIAHQYGVPLIKQPEGNLGQRMAKSIRLGLRQANQVMIIGTDCPSLNMDALSQASATTVFPANDGGYVLVACEQYQPKLFQQIGWSTGRVMTQTLRQARRAKLHLHRGPIMTDIDQIQDWKKARRQRLIGPAWRRR